MTTTIERAWPAPAGEPAAAGRERPGEIVPVALMAAGWAWIGGAYPWRTGEIAGQIAVTVVHVVPVALILWALYGLLTRRHERGARVTLTVLAVLGKVTTVVAAVWAATHTDGIGPQTFLDFVPIAVVNAGGGLWFLALITAGRRKAPDGTGRG